MFKQYLTVIKCDLGQFDSGGNVTQARRLGMVKNSGYLRAEDFWSRMLFMPPPPNVVGASY
jgi:hypothetical protein